MPPGIHKKREKLQAGGAGLGVSSLPVRARMTLSERCLWSKIRILRENTGDFNRKDICNYEDLWKKATNDFLTLSSRWLFENNHPERSESTLHYNPQILRGSTVSGRDTQRSKFNLLAQPAAPNIHDTTNIQVPMDTALRERTSRTITCSLPSRKGFPSGQIVPRLKEFGSIEDVIQGWRKGIVKSKGGHVKRTVVPQMLLLNAEMRVKAFNATSSKYSNRWWVDNHKSAHDRLRKVVENVATFNQQVSVRSMGRDHDWEEAIRKFKETNGKAVSKAKPFR